MCEMWQGWHAASQTREDRAEPWLVNVLNGSTWLARASSSGAVTT